MIVADVIINPPNTPAIASIELSSTIAQISMTMMITKVEKLISVLDFDSLSALIFTFRVMNAR